jgi:hypothetical protein
MRLLGLIAFLAASAGAAVAVRESFVRPRPIAVLLGLLAPVCVVLALTGLLLVFVPDFLG